MNEIVEFTKDVPLLIMTTVCFVLYLEDVLMSAVDDTSIGAFAMFMFAVAAIGIGYDMMSTGYVYLSVVLCGLYALYRVRGLELTNK